MADEEWLGFAPRQSQLFRLHRTRDKQQGIRAADLDIFTTAESASEAWAAIESWYAERGRSLFESRDTSRDDSA